ncbi:MAG: homoserine kinase [Nitrososphaerota archaeon]
MRGVLVEAPASSANLGPGFDVFALALQQPADRLRLSYEPSASLDVALEVRGSVGVPIDVLRNAASAVAIEMARQKGIRARLLLQLEKNVPVGIGLGSSAASSAAVAVAMNELFGLQLRPSELVAFAGVGERVASGEAHYDNVTASLLGGFVVVGMEGLSPLRLEPPAHLLLCLATPRVALPERKTEAARRLLPREVPLRSMVENMARACRIVAGFAQGDLRLVGEGMKDVVVEPVRSKLVPGYAKVREAALEAGALGVCISGAGPTMLALVDVNRAEAGAVLGAMLSAFEQAGVEAQGFITSVGEGARVLERF